MKRSKKTPREIAEEVSERLRAQWEKMKPEPDQVYQIHHNIRRMTNQFDTPGPDMRQVIDFNIPDDDSDIPVPVRLYIPHQASETPGPTFVYLHGGGFVTCSIESHEGICRRVASGSGFRVISVDYRLAPQFAYPAGPQDCEQALLWALSGDGAPDYGIDPARISLGGDSAGGNMTAFLAQKYRTRLCAQVLFYPLMQLMDFKPPKPGPQDWLQLGVMALKFIDEHYVVDADPNDTRLSPLFEKDLSGLPPAYVLTCGLDPLRDEGKAYATKLEMAGNHVEYCHEKALPHGFLNFSRAFPKGRKIPMDAADFLRKHTPSSH